MDRFFVELEDIDLENKSLNIYGEDVKHISKVLRYSNGDKIEVCDGHNKEYICEIAEISKDTVLLNIIEEVKVNRESRIKLKLYQGLPKSTKMDIILQKLTECGVSEIILVNTKRSIVNLNDKKADKKFERWERIVYEAAKQSKRGQIPKLRGVLSFGEALKDMSENDINIKPEMELSGTQLIKIFTESDFGIGIMPKQLLKEELESNKLKELSLEKPLTKRDVTLIYAKDKAKNIGIATFLKFINKKLTKEKSID